jgi:hypothetical protein
MKMKANKYSRSSTQKNKYLSSQIEHMFNKNSIPGWIASRVDSQVSSSDRVFDEQPEDIGLNMQNSMQII